MAKTTKDMKEVQQHFKEARRDALDEVYMDFVADTTQDALNFLHAAIHRLADANQYCDLWECERFQGIIKKMIIPYFDICDEINLLRGYPPSPPPADKTLVDTMEKTLRAAKRREKAKKKRIFAVVYDTTIKDESTRLRRLRDVIEDLRPFDALAYSQIAKEFHNLKSRPDGTGNNQPKGTEP